MNKLESMQTFVRVAEAGSFTAVADHLQVARSVVTRHIASLEKHLGIRLITRSTRSLRLTAAGVGYLEKCRVILNMVDAAESGLTEDRVIPRGRIRLGLPLSFTLRELSSVLLEFSRLHPQLELVMDLSDDRANLIEEGLDLALRITADLQPGDVVRQIGECRLLTLASPDYLARHGEPRHPSDLRHHECLIYASNSRPANWTYSIEGRAERVPVRGRIVANNGVLLADACARGMGIVRQPDFIAATYLARDELREVLRQYEGTPLGIYAVLPGNRYIPQRVSVLIDYLASALSRRNSGVPGGRQRPVKAHRQPAQARGHRRANRKRES